MITKDPLTLTGRKLGALVLPDFCERCYWIREHLEGDPPFAIPMPGIFNSIDAQTKHVVHAYFTKHGHAPEWLSEIGNDLESYVDGGLLSWRRYSYHDPKTGVLLRGSPDDIFIARDGSHCLVDYKTARWTPAQDRLLPMYAIQVNAYAYIAERARTFRPMRSVTLVYCEPVTGDIPAHDSTNHQPRGFKLGFAPKVVPVELDLAQIPPLMRRAREILSLDKPPERKLGCEGCYAIADLFFVHDGVLFTKDRAKK